MLALKHGGKPSTEAAYFRALEIVPNVFFRFDPVPCTTVIMITEIDAAMRPYSMAVAAVSSARNL